MADEDEPLLLVAYVYHLYMGLLSGGQLLSKKRQWVGNAGQESLQGNAVTTFHGDTPGNIKKKLRAAINTFGQELDIDLQQRIIQEGINVFKMNNSIIHAVEGVDEIFYKRLFKILAILVAIVAVIYLLLC